MSSTTKLAHLLNCATPYLTTNKMRRLLKTPFWMPQYWTIQAACVLINVQIEWLKLSISDQSYYDSYLNPQTLFGKVGDTKDLQSIGKKQQKNWTFLPAFSWSLGRKMHFPGASFEEKQSGLGVVDSWFVLQDFVWFESSIEMQYQFVGATCLHGI